jgi:hypothetical protein
MSDKLEKDIQRGQRAANLLDDDLVKEAFAHIESELWRKFKELPPSATKDLEFIKGMQYLSVKFKAFFEQAVVNGKLASINLEARKKGLRERIFG